MASALGPLCLFCLEVGFCLLLLVACHHPDGAVGRQVQVSVIRTSSSLLVSSAESPGARYEDSKPHAPSPEAHLSTLALTRSILGTGTVPSARLDFHSPCSAFTLPAFWCSCEPVTMPQALRSSRASVYPSTCASNSNSNSPLHFSLDPLGRSFPFGLQPRRLCFCLSFFLQLLSLSCPTFGSTRDRTDGLRARAHHKRSDRRIKVGREN